MVTANVRCPAPSSACLNRSRTNAVSSATTTVRAGIVCVSERRMDNTRLHCRMSSDLAIISTFRGKLRHPERMLSMEPEMATCPECEFDEIETEDFEEGDTLSCPECGKTLVMSSAGEVDVADDDDDDDDLDDEEEEDAEDEDDDDEDEDEDEELED